MREALSSSICHLDPLDVGQAGQEIARVPHEGEAHVGPVAVEHPRSAAHRGLRLLEIAELLDALAGHDRDGVGVREHVEEPDVELLQGEAHGVLVERLHPVERGEHVGVGVALDRAEPLHRVHHVVGGQLAAVDRRLVLPAHAAAELEDVGGLVRLGPGFGQVALDREGAGGYRGAGLVLEEAAVGERVGDVGLVGNGQVGIPVRRVPEAEAQGAAPAWSLGPRGPGRESAGQGRNGEGAGSEG